MNDEADANFDLVTDVAAGTETANASTNSRTVCDAAGNCATAGPVSGIRVDRKAPEIAVASPMATTYTQSQTVQATYTCSDGGGIASCSGTIASGQNIDTASSGAHDFVVARTGPGGERLQRRGHVSSASTVRQRVDERWPRQHLARAEEQRRRGHAVRSAGRDSQERCSGCVGGN